jgi:UDP-N-acetylglucosamine:LPS N-acetylglucosamine transferase
VLDVARSAAEASSDLVRLRPFGLRQDMPTLMAAATIIAGKPGGLTVSEALAAGRPFAIIQPYPIQEEANAGMLLEQGVAIRIDPLTTFAPKLRSLLQDRDRHDAMSARARSIARPGAAFAVAESARRLLES